VFFGDFIGLDPIDTDSVISEACLVQFLDDFFREQKTTLLIIHHAKGIPFSIGTKFNISG
jgi:hypothetical protein